LKKLNTRLAKILWPNQDESDKVLTTILHDPSQKEKLMKGLNVPHVIACNVLKVPCQNGWVERLEHTVWHLNSRTGDPGLTAQQLDNLEWLFRQQDCAYCDKLLILERTHNKNTNISNNDGWTLTILQNDTLWQDCDQYDDHFQQSLRKNTSHLLYLVQSVGGRQYYQPERYIVMEQKQQSSRNIWKRPD
jgi:hypothetical protein